MVYPYVKICANEIATAIIHICMTQVATYHLSFEANLDDLTVTKRWGATSVI